MKKLIIVSIFSLGMWIHSDLSAQVQVNINISSQPLWGPVGYDQAAYYYLPDVEAYYNVSRGQFIYLNNGRWIFSSTLPPRYARFNLFDCYKVVINSPTPYLHFKDDRIKYAKYKGWMGKQKAIKYSNDPKYFVVKGHPHGKPPGQAKKTAIPEQNMGRNEHHPGKGKH